MAEQINISAELISELAIFARENDRKENSCKATIVFSEFSINLNFSDTNLRKYFLGALEHIALPAPLAKADFELHIFQDPNPPMNIWKYFEFNQQGIIHKLTYPNGKFFTFLDWNHEGEIFAYEMINFEKKLGYIWINSKAKKPFWERGAPLRLSLAAILRWKVMHVIHAAALDTPAGAIIIAGKGGSGKSSTICSCLSDKLKIYGDDYVVVSQDKEQKPSVCSIYNTIKVFSDDKKYYNFTSSVASEAVIESNKEMYFVNKTMPELMQNNGKILALVLPNISSDQKISFEKIQIGTFLTGLIPSTVSQIHGFAGPTVAILSQTLAKLPAYRVNLTPERGKIAKAFLDFAKEVSANV